MVKKIKFENSSGRNLQLCIEPLAEYIDWEKGKFLEIELKLRTDKYNDDLDFALSENILIIYECRQYEMKVSIDKELKYHTPSNLYL